MLSKKETMKQWLDAGIYFHYKWGTGYRKSDTVMVYSNFSKQFDNILPAIVPRNPQILLFDHHLKTLSMNVSNGKVISISVN
jgi:hypothetical protein